MSRGDKTCFLFNWKLYKEKKERKKYFFIKKIISILAIWKKI